MQWKSVSRMSMLAIPTMIVCGLLVAASSMHPKARADNDESDNGLKGTWRVQVTVRNCQTGEAQRTFPALFTFATGGTLTAVTGGQPPALATPGLGVWRHTNGRTYSAVSEAFVFSPAGVWAQTHRLTRSIEIDNDADAFTDTIALEIFDTNGNVIVKGCGTSVGSRFK